MRNKFNHILPDSQILTSTAELKLYGKDWLEDFKPNPSCILLPNTTKQIQEIVRVCNNKKIPLVPSGGRTGLSGGATATNGEVVLSFKKLNKIIEVSDTSRTITCQAGVITQRVQEEADQHGLYFPVDFASKGSSQIGGNIATNAGGIRVIKYGNIRDWVLGLKVVTAQGKLLNLNGHLFKNQTGYDLKSLFIGSEGTLGIITEATLKLTTPPGELTRILCGIEALEIILELLQNLRQAFPDISAFEFFPRNGLEKVLSHHGLQDPFNAPCPYYLLIEVEQMNEQKRGQIEEHFFQLMESEKLTYVVISQNIKQCAELMAFRELLSETLSTLYTLHKNDIAVPIDSIPKFTQELYDAAHHEYPEYEIVIFGHIGDGNLHVNILKPSETPKEDFFNHCKKADHNLFALVKKHKGTISAEHGVGLLKKPYLPYTRSPEEIQLMKEIKTVFDPSHILNPGKIVDF